MRNAIALGTFDGLHIGHIKVLSLPDVYNKTAVTFAVPPKSAQNAAGLLLTFKEKEERLAQLGIKSLKLDFCSVRDTEPADFLLWLKAEFNPAYISCGYNYRFGKNAAGDTGMLASFCEKNGIILNVCAPVEYGGGPVSSTRIRKLLETGDIGTANAMLSQPFSFTSVIEKGDQRGRTLGFPTANQFYPSELVKLRPGVYKTEVIFDKKTYIGLSDIGTRPTFPAEKTICETHIPGFGGVLYGKEVCIRPTEFIREERKFSSAEELKTQISMDISAIFKEM